MMIKANLKYWDYLAPAWTAWENSGMTPASLQHIYPLLTPPVLVIGAGQGLIVDWLLKNGKECIGVDVSEEMRRYAKQRRGLNIQSGLAENLPFEKDQFCSVIITTGVVNSCDMNRITAIFAEANRVLIKEGIIATGLFVPTQASLKLGHHLGYFLDGKQMQHRLFQIWAAAVDNAGMQSINDNTFEQWAHLVAKWTRCSPLDAYQRVIGYGETFRSVVDHIDRGANLLRQQHIEPYKQLDRAMDFELVNLLPLAVTYLEKLGNQMLSMTHEKSIATLTLVAIT